MEIHDRIIKSCKNEDPNVRRASAVALGNMGITQAKGPLAALLKDKFPVVKEAAINALSKLNAVEVVEHLTAILNPEDGDVRKAILQTVSSKTPPQDQKSEEEAAMGLTPEKLLEQWKVKRAAALALCKLNPDIAVAPLIAALAHDNINVKIASIAGLGNMESQTAGPKLLELTKSEAWEVRKAVATALGKIRYEPAIDSLVELLKDSRFAVRIEAIIALNHFKTLDILGPLSNVIGEDDNVDVKRTAVIALGNLQTEYAIPSLTQACSDPAWQVRKAAVTALASLKFPQVLDPLIVALTDENEEVSHVAALAYPKVAAAVESSM